MKSSDELTRLFRERGLKVTPQRQRIFGVLFDNDSHPSAEAVHAEVAREMPTISLRTVYRTLDDLADMGELGKLDLGTGSARFDPSLQSHHHLVCESCGSVADLYADFTDVSVPAAQAEGFVTSRTEIVFHGVCEVCRRAATTASDRRSHRN